MMQMNPDEAPRSDNDRIEGTARYVRESARYRWERWIAQQRYPHAGLPYPHTSSNTRMKFSPRMPAICSSS